MNAFPSHLVEFEIDNVAYYFIRMLKSNRLLCWKTMASQCDSWSGRGVSVHARKVGKDNLQFLKLWDSIPKDDQQKIEAAQEEIVINVVNKMAKARAARKKKYENIPKEITCSNCNKVQKMNPGIIAKKIEKLNVLLDDYLKNFQCQKCNPTKGRKANPKYKDMPEELICKCGASVKANYTYLSKKAEAKKITLDDLIKSYQCQKCHPTKGRKKGQKTKIK